MLPPPLIVTEPYVPWVTAVTSGVPSKLSLPSTLVVTAVSSLVLAVSSTTSATGATVMASVSVSESAPSLVAMVRLIDPLAL